jgi:hypothetical protein
LRGLVLILIDVAHENEKIAPAVMPAAIMK